MALATIDLLNEVLTGLRKENIASGTTSVTSAYHLLLLQFINRAKDVVEQSWDWQALRTELTVSITQGTYQYSLPAATKNSRLLYVNQLGANERTVTGLGFLPQVFDTTDPANTYRLKELRLDKIKQLLYQDNSIQAIPMYFALERTNSGVNIYFYPRPEKTRTVKVRMVVPQTKLPSTDITVQLTVPDQPVWLRALEMANDERGSDIGQTPTELMSNAAIALADAIDLERTDEDDTGYPQ